MNIESQLLKFANKIKEEVNCMLPARVVQVNNDGTVNVVAIRNDDIDDCVITVPVILPETQRSYIYLATKPGDRGIVKFCDKSIEAYRKGSEKYNNDTRNHSLSDGVFQLGFLPSNEKFLFPDGEIVIGLKNNTFVFTVNENGSLTLNAKNIIINTSKTEINSDVDIKGELKVTGNILTTGTMTANGGVRGNGIDLENHTHNYHPGDGGLTPTEKPNQIGS